MRKICFVFLFICGAVLFAQTSGSTTGVIKEMTGTVEIKLPGEAAFSGAKVGDQLTQDTIISTGFRSFAIIEIGSALITVRPITSLTLTAIQASAETETLNVNLVAGRVKVDVKPPAGAKAAASVVSPSAVASVRGTSFEFDTRNLYVDNGIVSFAGNRGQTVLVKAGGESQVGANARAVPPMEVKLARIVPASPVGSEIAGIIPSGPARQGVTYTIVLDFFRP